MARSLLVLTLLLGTVVYALAEDITMTTFYPSPRGVYNQLRTMGQTTLAETGGNVGIGTTTPGAKLHMISAGDTIRLQGTANGAGNVTYLSFYDNAGTRLGYLGDATGANSNIYLDPENGANLILASAGGNVGIGTTTPGAKLDIQNWNSGAGLHLNYGSATGQVAAINLKANGVDNGLIGIQMRQSPNEGDMWLGAGSRLMTLTSNGNVGIGTTTPPSKLTVTGSGTGTAQLGVACGANYAGLTLNKDAATAPAGCGEYNVLSSPTDRNLYLNRPTGFGMYFRENNGEQMMIQAATGNVGIGTAAPGQKLEVQGGNARVNNVFLGDVGHGVWWAGFANQNQASTTGYSVLAAQDGAYTLINKQNTGSGYIGFRVANVDQMVILNNGNVGIGTTAPTSTLHVAGNIFATGSISVPSDGRFKTAVAPLTGALAKLDGIQAISFERNALGQALGQPGGRRELGVLAQELEQSYPELVTASGPEAYRAVDYSRLTVVLLEAVKELKAEVDRLQAKINELEKARK